MKKTTTMMASLILAFAVTSGAADLRVGGVGQNAAKDTDQSGVPKGAFAQPLARKSAISESQIIVTPTNNMPEFNSWIAAIRMPVRANTNDFEIASTNLAHMMFTNGGHAVNPLGFRLSPMDVMQPASHTNSTLWFPIMIESTSGATFYPGNLSSVISSSDTNNYLKSTTDLKGNVTFSSRAIGIIWTNAEHTAGQILDSPAHGKLSEVAVHMFIFIGAQCPYFEYSNGADAGAITNFINGHPNWQVTCRWSLTNNSGGVSAFGIKTLDTTRVPEKPILSLAADGTQSVTGVINDGLTSAALYYRDSATASRRLLSTVNNGNIAVLPAVGLRIFEIFTQ